MSELREKKIEAEKILQSAIRGIAECLSYPIEASMVSSIRDEVIKEVVRLNKERGKE